MVVEACVFPRGSLKFNFLGLILSAAFTNWFHVFLRGLLTSLTTLLVLCFGHGLRERSWLEGWCGARVMITRFVSLWQGCMVGGKSPNTSLRPTNNNFHDASGWVLNFPIRPSTTPRHSGFNALIISPGGCTTRDASCLLHHSELLSDLRMKKCSSSITSIIPLNVSLS